MTEKLVEVANYFGLVEDVKRLTTLEKISSNGLLYVPVFGHYSAGKSMLLNNLLGKSILPVGLQETTAVLTYLQYAPQESVRILYCDGHSQQAELKVLGEVYQNNPTYRVEEIDHVEVFVNAPLLARGLVLVDTPGVNTVLPHHLELTAMALEQSHKMLYVLGGAMTAVDREFLQKSKAMGLEILPVRTKCDRFQECEESSREALEQEETMLSELLGQQVDFYPVSNLEGQPYYDGIPKLAQRLYQDSQSIGAEIAKSCQSQMEVYRQAYVARLQEQADILTAQLAGDKQVLSQALDRKSQEIYRLEQNLEKRQDVLSDQLSQKEKEALRQGRQLVEDQLDRVQKAGKANLDMTADNRKNLCCKAATQTVNRCAVMVGQLLNEVMEDVAVENGADLEQWNGDYNATANQVSNTLSLYQTQMQTIRNQLVTVQDEQKQLLEQGAALSQAYNQQDFDTAIATLDNELQNISNVVAMKFSDKQPMQPSTLLRGVGNALDLALLLIPGDAIVAGVKAVANTTKIAQVINKTGQAGKALTRMIQGADTVRDTAMVLNTIARKRGYSTQAHKAKAENLVNGVAQAAGNQYEKLRQGKQEGNVLDMLSISYWTEKLGRAFDKPPAMEVDQETEDAKTQLRQQLTSQHQQLLQEKIRQQKELGLLKTKAEEQSYRERNLESMAQQVEQQMAREEAAMAQKAKQKALDQWLMQYGQYVEDTVRPYIKQMIQEQFAKAKSNISMYIAMKHENLSQKIDQEKKQLEILEQNGQPVALETALSLCQEYLRQLEEIA